MLAAVYKIVEQFFSKKPLNAFPARHKPCSVSNFLAKGQICPPVTVPDNYRGKLLFDYDKCIGCGLCEKVCPAKAIELYPVVEKEKKSKRIVIFLSRCTYCSECVRVCPKAAIEMNKEFLLADYDKYSEEAVIGSTERKQNEVVSDAN